MACASSTGAVMLLGPASGCPLGEFPGAAWRAGVRACVQEWGGWGVGGGLPTEGWGAFSWGSTWGGTSMQAGAGRCPIHPAARAARLANRN
jgi:hypothetical protein